MWVKRLTAIAVIDNAIEVIVIASIYMSKKFINENRFAGVKPKISQMYDILCKKFNSDLKE